MYHFRVKTLHQWIKFWQNDKIPILEEFLGFSHEMKIFVGHSKDPLTSWRVSEKWYEPFFEKNC